MITPAPYSGRAAGSAPESSSASLPTVSAIRVTRSVEGSSLLGMCSSSTKPGISPAMRTG